MFSLFEKLENNLRRFDAYQILQYSHKLHYTGEFIVDLAHPITAILSLDINSTAKQLLTMDATAPWPFVSVKLSQCRIFLLKSQLRLSDTILRNWQEDYPRKSEFSYRKSV